jgi:serine/threonine protein kinase
VVTGTTISHYRILEKVGEGAAGIVYRAEDLTLGRAVAIKVLCPERSSNGSAVLGFQHEARMASSFNHPNICAIHEIGEHEGQQFVVMELLDGSVLSDLISARALTVDEVIDFGIQMADALEAAHGEGIIHRDLKPTNIFVTRRGHVKILDFGLALLAVSSTASKSHRTTHAYGVSVAGTAPYMSPEQVRGDELDVRSDLFSMGSVLYEMVTGRRAFDGKTRVDIHDQILSIAPAAPSLLNSDVPGELERIIKKALEKNRALRLQSAAELRADLCRLRRDIQGASLVMQRRPATEWYRSGTATAAAAVASIVIFFGVVMLRGSWPLVMTTPAAPAPPPSPPMRVGAAAVSVPELPRVVPVTPGSQPSKAEPETRQIASTPIAAPSIVPTRSNTQAVEELRVAKTKAAAGLYTQALKTLQDLVVRYSGTDEALDAYFLMASINEKQALLDEALAGYLEIATRFEGHTRVPEALFRLSEVALRTDRKERVSEARAMFARAADEYGTSPWASRALLSKGELEARHRLHERDVALGVTPSALVTYRRITIEYPDSAEAEQALSRLAILYEETKRYEMAAEAFSQLASRYPHTSGVAWFRAAELYRRRLDDSQKAQAAYDRVPATSRHFADAQKQLKNSR